MITVRYVQIHVKPTVLQIDTSAWRNPCRSGAGRSSCSLVNHLRRRAGAHPAGRLLPRATAGLESIGRYRDLINDQQPIGEDAALERPRELVLAQDGGHGPDAHLARPGDRETVEILPATHGRTTDWSH